MLGPLLASPGDIDTIRFFAKDSSNFFSDDWNVKIRLESITADAEHRLNVIYASGRVLEAGCNAHGVRKFDDAEVTQPSLATEGRGFLSAMYAPPTRLALKSSASSATRSSNIAADSFGHLQTSSNAGATPSRPPCCRQSH